MFQRLMWCALLLAACGKSGAEAAVSATNASIRRVEAASQTVADAVAHLPGRDLTTADFAEVVDRLKTYVAETESLNAAVRTLATEVPPLAAHVDTAFRPGAEEALKSCQDAMDVFARQEATSDEHTRAIARTGACLERYAAAITAVSAEYGRLSP